MLQHFLELFISKYYTALEYEITYTTSKALTKKV